MDPIEAAISKYVVRGNMSKLDNPNFHFEYISLDKKLKELGKLDPKKASQVNHIPVKVIKEHNNIVVFVILHNVNNLLSSYTFKVQVQLQLIIKFHFMIYMLK